MVAEYTRHDGRLLLVAGEVVFDQRRCLLLTHSATLFTIFEADVTASALRATRQLVSGLIGRELRREELPAGTFGDLEQQEALLAKTAERAASRAPTWLNLTRRCGATSTAPAVTALPSSWPPGASRSDGHATWSQINC